MNGQPQPGMQTSIFPEQPTHTMNPEPVMQPAPQQIPQEMPQPVYGTNGAYIQPAPNRPVMQGTSMPQGATMQPYPQQPAYQPETVPYTTTTGTAADKRPYIERNNTGTERKRTGIPDCAGYT